MSVRAVIYTRASFDRTGEGKSNSRQEEECERLCEYKRWDITDRVGDYSISAYGDKVRPGWNKVLGMIEAGEVDVVVAYHLDRLTRNMADLEKLIVLCEEHNVSVATATGDLDLTNDTGRMVARILAAVARQEVERKAARQKLAHAQRRAEGRPWASVKMLGYERDGTLIEHEAKAIRDAMRDVIEDRASLAELGRRWQELGLTSPYKADDKPWTAAGVRQVLKNPRLAGLVVHEGEVLGKGNWEPIISETEMTLLLAKFSDPARRLTKGTPGVRGKPTNLLTGIMRCGVCDETVRAGNRRGRYNYICGNNHSAVPRQSADALVRSSVAAVLATTSPGIVLGSGKVTVDGEAVEEEIGRLRERQGVLARSFARGLTTEDAYEGAVVEIADQIKELEAQLEHSGPAIDLQAIRAESVSNFLGQDFHEQRRVLERLAVVTMHRVSTHKGRRYSSAKEQVEVQVRGKRGESEVLIPAFIPEALLP